MSTPTQNCQPKSAPAAALSLPVIPSDPEHTPKGAGAPRSRMGWRRATVLIVIQVLMIVHVLQWAWTGETFRPVEPSETMETVKDGVINVGAVFFVLALASTALLGRWFCGWGCHIVMLQDLCGWMMKRVGIRPRLFRSRLLLWMPLALAVYMFLWPLVYRFAIAPYTRPDLSWPGFTTSFMVTDFWATFPGWLVGVPFILVCSFLTVYLLGAKGYCTYGCPYGGFFAPLDELSPVRIRVSDACTQCGHCTAVCTSNVRVHEEVRDYRMVVDQGCMKCLDCVSACPEQALRVGFGVPAFMAKPVVERPAAPRWDLGWNEEIGLAAVTVASLFAVRGAISVPLLFAAGIAACATGLAWFLLRMVRDRNARLHRLQLRRDGRITAQGVGFAVVAIASLGVLSAVGSVNAMIAVADFDGERVTVSPQVVFSGRGSLIEDSTRARAERGIARYQRALGLATALRLDGLVRGGIDARLAWLESVVGRYGEAAKRLQDRAEREGLHEDTARGLVQVMRGAGDIGGALAFARAQSEANPTWTLLREEFVSMLIDEDDYEGALAVTRRAVAFDPGDFTARRRLAAILVESVRNDHATEGLALFEALVAEHPADAMLLLGRASGLHRLGRIEDAERDLRRGIEMAPDEWRLHQALADFLMSIDRQKEAGPVMKKAGDLRVKALKR